MRLVLYANETPDESTLMHYRVGGEKTGVRRFQNKDGSLTSEGYQHYKEMYGWGDGDKAKGGPAKPESGKKNLGIDDRSVKELVKKSIIDADGNLTQKGIQKVEDSSRYYLNPSRVERESGITKERDRINAERNKKYWEAVDDGMDPNQRSEKDRRLWDDYKDPYAEATLKDLKLPVTATNIEVVKKSFAKYDPAYDYEGLGKAEDVDKYEKEFSDRWNSRKNAEPSRSDNSRNEVSEKDFNRELKKLQKLSDNTNIGLQKKEAQKYDLIAKKNLENIVTRTASAGVMTLISGTDFVKGLAMPLASAGMAAYSKARSAIAKQRMTDVGHGKAVEKYNQQFDKMIEMFSGTPYQTLLTQSRNKKIT